MNFGSLQLTDDHGKDDTSLQVTTNIAADPTDGKGDGWEHTEGSDHGAGVSRTSPGRSKKDGITGDSE